MQSFARLAQFSNFKCPIYLSNRNSYGPLLRTIWSASSHLVFSYLQPFRRFFNLTTPMSRTQKFEILHFFTFTLQDTALIFQESAWNFIQHLSLSVKPLRKPKLLGKNAKVPGVSNSCCAGRLAPPLTLSFFPRSFDFLNWKRSNIVVIWAKIG